MPFTEIVTASIAQTQEAREAFHGPVWSTLAPIVSKFSGCETQVKGHMLIQNNEKIPDSTFLPVLGFEYNDSADFYKVIKSDDFKDFVESIKPIATAKVIPEVYETDVLPKEVFSSPVSEIFRIKIYDDQTKETTARAEWEKFSNTLNEKNVLSGVSINLDERLFLGVVGWKSFEDRENSLKKVRELRQKDLDWKDSFVVEFSR
ncbi:hypothetical protein ACMFMG_000459 [Clarireedia jacksonii]